MLDSDVAKARAFIRELIADVRFADVLDVLVIAAVIYLAIAWFRRSRSRFVMGGFATLAALYVLARAADMYLTLLVFQALITVALVAVVVIFQEEIRRAFEQIAIRGQLTRQLPTGPRESVATVVEACSQLANRRIGALFVFRGKEPLERHVSAGVALEGRPSEALLYSIFDPHSAGHDGAVIIESGLVRQFGVHLPLSTHGQPGLGTRHTAAIGLSERSDAFVIVISEERGTISVARGGELRVVSPAELATELDAFSRSLAPTRPEKRLFRVLFENPGTKALSLALALTAWLLLFGPLREKTTRSFSVPVAYRDVPEGFMLDAPNPQNVRVTLVGPTRAFASLQESSLTISLDVGAIKPGMQRMPIGDEEIAQPRELSIQRIEPKSVVVVARRSPPKP
jgi:diadenylate cyclase